jgi:acyl carrier protein
MNSSRDPHLLDVVIAAVRSQFDHRPEATLIDSESRLWSSGEETSGSSLDLDSIDLIELFIDLEERLGVDVSGDLGVADVETIGDLVELLAKAPKQ